MDDQTAGSTSDVILRIHDVSVSYGKVRAVDRLNLTVHAGEIYGFLGRNGAGKTSTIRAVMGVIKPDQGHIELLEYRGRRMGVKQKQRIGYVSQEQHFYSWMSCRGLGRFVGGFYPTWDPDEFERLLALLELPPRRRVSHLSGGMRVKLALALALAHRPPILILDEPTAGLDPVTRREFLEIISQQARAHDRTTFFSSHLIDEVERVADRVGIIHRGQLRYEGDIERLRESVREVSHGPSPGGEEVVTVANTVEFREGENEGANESELPVEAELVSPVDGRGPGDMPNAAGDESTSAAPIVASGDAGRREFAELAVSRGFAVLRDGFGDTPSSVVYGTADAWEQGAFSEHQIRRLSLEDIFIAMTAEATPIL